MTIEALRYVTGCAHSDAGGYDSWLHKYASSLVSAVEDVLGAEDLKFVLRE